MAGPPRLTRQESVRRVQENKSEISACINCCSFPAAIAAIVIASTYDYDGSPCDGTNYTIDLVTFLYVAGCISVGYTGLFCIGFAFQSEDCLKSLSGLGLPLSLFYLAWSIIGVVMYVDQMSDSCQSESIALMIISFCGIELGVRALTCCCLCVFICCTAFAAVLDPDDSGNRRQLLDE